MEWPRCGRRSSLGRAHTVCSQVEILRQVGGRSLIIRPEVWVGARREGGHGVIEARKGLRGLCVPRPQV